LGEALGVVRTQELLAARRIDGGQQFFTRAIDFGFSKDYRQTFRIWDRTQVLADVVRTIRGFRPDVLITRFSTVPGGNSRSPYGVGDPGGRSLQACGRHPMPFLNNLAS